MLNVITTSTSNCKAFGLLNSKKYTYPSVQANTSIEYPFMKTMEVGVTFYYNFKQYNKHKCS